MSVRPKKVHGPKAYLLVMGVSLLIGLLGGGVAGALQLAPGALGTGLTAAALALGMAVVLAAVIWWWRGIDEAAREAHKWAWWWGGTGGMGVGAVVLITFHLRQIDEPALTSSGFASGMFAMMVMQVVGYSIAWAFWWLRNR